MVEALKTLVHTKVGRLPVVDDDGMLVGIITKGDINRGLLKALQHDYQEEEIRRYRASHLFEDIVSGRTSLILRYVIKPRDFTHGGSASSYIKRALLRLGSLTANCPALRDRRVRGGNEPDHPYRPRRHHPGGN